MLFLSKERNVCRPGASDDIQLPHRRDARRFFNTCGGCSAVLPCHAQGKIHLQGMVSVAVIRSRCPHIYIRARQFLENESAPGCRRLLAEYFRAAARIDLVSGCFPYNIPFPQQRALERIFISATHEIPDCHGCDFISVQSVFKEFRKRHNTL